MKKRLFAMLFLSAMGTFMFAACSKKGPDGVEECEALKKIVADCKGPQKSTYDETLKTSWEAWKEADRETVKKSCKEVGESWKQFCK
ncbi:MAG: hypothetical protein U0271_14470 [Polyangiaceae bacterium]